MAEPDPDRSTAAETDAPQGPGSSPRRETQVLSARETLPAEGSSSEDSDGQRPSSHETVDLALIPPPGVEEASAAHTTEEASPAGRPTQETAPAARPTEALTQEALLAKRRRRTTLGKLEEAISSSSGRVARATPPPRLGRYEIRGELGRGGAGVVYLAWDPRLQREIALKTLLAGRDASEVMIERFLREVRASSRLRHPHIVSVHDAGVVDGHFYLAMDRIEGRSLAALLDTEGALEPRRAVDLIAPVARALAHAHSEGFLHRDVKPENVLVDANGTPYLTDFGLAVDLRDGERLTHSNQALGTPAFMAPEQLRGKHRDPRVDVYALGATLYECVTGRVPFLADSYPELMHQVLTSEPDPPRSLAPLLAPDLEAVILTCLEKEPERRYPGPADLAADLERFQRGEAVRARLPSFGRRVWQRAQRHRAVALGTSVAVGGVLLGGLGAFWIYQDAAREFRRTGRLEEERGRLLQTQRERARREEARSAASAEAALAATTEDAIRSYSRLLERYPESWEGRVARARLHRQRSRELRARGRDLEGALRAARAALEDLDQALREADRGALRLLKAELLRVDLRDHEAALQETRRVASLKDEPALAAYARARLAYVEQDFAESEKAAKEALKQRSLAPARLLLAELQLQRRQPNDALSELDALAGRSEYAAEVTLLRGLALQDLGSPQDAENDALRARELDPLEPRAHYLLADLRLERKQAGSALAPAKRATDLDPRSGAAWLLLARVQLALGDARGARDAYQHARQAAVPPEAADLEAFAAEAAALWKSLEDAVKREQKAPRATPTPAPPKPPAGEG